MKFKEIIDELYCLDTYKNFKSENPDSFLSAGFFIFNLEEKTESIQIDFFLPKESKIVGFEYPFKEPKKFDDNIVSMKELSPNIKIDLDDLELKCLEVIKKNESIIKPTKIIAILKEGVWNLTCMDNMLGIIRIHLNASTGEVIKFDKGSLMDFMGIKKGNKDSKVSSQ